MKKLMLAVAVVCAAVAADAAVIKWGSGAIQTPDEVTGALSGTKLTTASGYNIKMYVWESLSASAVSYSAGDLFSWYDKGATGSDPMGGSLTALSLTPAVGASATTATITGAISPDTDGTSVYAAILFVLEDSTTGDAKWYMENSGEKASAKSIQTLGNLALKVGGTGAATTWTAAAVPEPTSGLLLLLGMAGLALKRKRA